MKKLKALLAVVLCAFFLTGCTIKYETNMSITSDGRMNVVVVSGFDKEGLVQMIQLFESMNNTEEQEEGQIGTDEVPAKTYTDAEIEGFLYSNVESENETKLAAEKAGFTVERYHEGDIFGYKYSATINDISAVSDTNPVSFKISDLTDSETKLSEKKMFRKVDNIYYATLVFDASDQDANSQMSENESSQSTSEEMKQMLSQVKLDFKYIVTLPVGSISNNATSVSEDGKTLTWDIKNTGNTNIEYTFELTTSGVVTGGNSFIDQIVNFFSSEDVSMYIGIGAIAILVILVLIVVAKGGKKKKKQPEATEQTEATTTAATPSAVQTPTPVEQPAAPSPEATPAVNPTVETPSVAQTPTPVEQPAQQTPVAPAATLTVETPNATSGDNTTNAQ